MIQFFHNNWTQQLRYTRETEKHIITYNISCWSNCKRLRNLTFKKLRYNYHSQQPHFSKKVIEIYHMGYVSSLEHILEWIPKWNTTDKSHLTDFKPRRICKAFPIAINCILMDRAHQHLSKNVYFLFDTSCRLNPQLKY